MNYCISWLIPVTAADIKVGQSCPSEVFHWPRNERERRTVAHICNHSHIWQPHRTTSTLSGLKQTGHLTPTSPCHSHTARCTARELVLQVICTWWKIKSMAVIYSNLSCPIEFHLNGTSLSLPVLHKQPSMSIVFLAPVPCHTLCRHHMFGGLGSFFFSSEV